MASEMTFNVLYRRHNFGRSSYVLVWSSDPFTDNYLIVSDMFQRNIFQVRINTADVRAVLSRAPVSIIANYSAIALDPVNQVVYWADVGTGTIGKTVFGGSDAVLFAAGAGECFTANMNWI